MKQNFHISKDGTVRPCTAQPGNCRLGGDTPHFKTEVEAQDYADNKNKSEFGLLPKKTEKTSKERLTDELSEAWNGDESMIKHCLKSSKYVEIGGSFVDVTEAKPSIENVLYYDDETEAPENNFENFRAYNERLHMPSERQLRGRSFHGNGGLKMVQQYTGQKEGLGLASLTYDDNPEGEYRDVSEEELEQINKGIREVQEDYTKRLKTYYKRYGDKVYTSGYWANR